MRAYILRSRRLHEEHGLGAYGVWLRESGAFIGECGIIDQKVDGAREWELSYTFARAARGCGYATEAGSAMRDHARTQGVQRLISLVRPENEPSRRVAERLGARIERETTHAGLRHLVYVYD